MKIAALLFLISAIGAGLSYNFVGTNDDFYLGLPSGVWMLVVFRIIGGIGVGVASVIAPMYIAETSPPRIRGRLGSLQQLAIVTGIFLSLAIDYVLAELAGGSREVLWLGLEAWRWMFFMMAVPAIVYGLLAFTIPESPRYLVAKYRIPEARKVLSSVARREEPRVDDHPDPGFAESREAAVVAGSAQADRRHLRDRVGGLGLSVFQQFVGINVIFYYSNVLWEAVGFGESASFIITVITSMTNIVTTLIAIALIDKVGRKPLLLVGSSGMAVTLGRWRSSSHTAEVVDGKPDTRPPGRPVRSLWSRPTCSWWRSACRGVRWCGCCSARCSPTASARPRWALPRQRSGWRTG